MALEPYKPNQGAYARGVAGAALMVLNLFACWRFYSLLDVQAQFRFLGMRPDYGVLWAAALFLVISALIAVFTLGLHVGLGALDARTRAAVDLLIDTQNELQKVSWPGPEELRRSTIVVLVCIAVLGGYLVVVDLLVANTMEGLSVLPAPKEEVLNPE